MAATSCIGLRRLRNRFYFIWINLKLPHVASGYWTGGQHRCYPWEFLQHVVCWLSFQLAFSIPAQTICLPSSKDGIYLFVPPGSCTCCSFGPGGALLACLVDRHLFIHTAQPRFCLFCEAFPGFPFSPSHSWEWVNSTSPTALHLCVFLWTCPSYCSVSWAGLLQSGGSRAW